jgi:hypothetical protein
MTIPPVISTVAQLIGSLVSTANSAHELAKKSSDHALKGAVSKLCDEIRDVKMRVLELDQENRELKAALTQKDEIIGPTGPLGYFFYEGKPDQPLCPKCFQSLPSATVFLSPLKSINGGTRRYCRICGRHYTETPLNPPQIPIGPARFSSR